MMLSSVGAKEQKKLLLWFEAHKRDLPWRRTKDPYKIWVSEVLLQQTVSKTAIPYYKRIIKKFPHVSALAKAKKAELFSIWAGLGYYKRTENLSRAAKELKKLGGFPKTYKELIKLSGFGPYTSRAVSSLAFEEPAGVLDGNVIRLLSRWSALPVEWWKAKGRARLQSLSDMWIKNQQPSQMNQALMELGSLICLSKNPLCLLCPLAESCQAHKKGLKNKLPLKRAKKATEFWIYRPEKIKKGACWAFAKNTDWPFLKGRWMFPGKAEKISGKAKCDFTHSIMNYQIFVAVQNKKLSPALKANLFLWLSAPQIKRLNPSSLIQKILNQA